MFWHPAMSLSCAAYSHYLAVIVATVPVVVTFGLKFLIHINEIISLPV